MIHHQTLQSMLGAHRHTHRVASRSEVYLGSVLVELVQVAWVLVEAWEAKEKVEEESVLAQVHQMDNHRRHCSTACHHHIS